MEDFQHAIALWVVRGREYSIYSQLLKDLVHEAVFELCAIVRWNVTGAHVYW